MGRMRLIKLLASRPEGSTAIATADHLLENGVIVPPCEPGDKVLDHFGRIYIVDSIRIYKNAGGATGEVAVARVPEEEDEVIYTLSICSFKEFAARFTVQTEEDLWRSGTWS